MNEEQIQAILDRVDEKVDEKIASMFSDAGSITPVAFEQKWMKGYTSTMPIDQALFRRFLRSVVTSGKYFKTIGGVTATQNDDSMSVVGQGGINVTGNSKTLWINGSGLIGYIEGVIEWNNPDINRSRVAMWMKGVVDSPMENMFIRQLSDITAWHKYWDEMKSRIGVDDGMWVAYDNEHLCYVSKGHHISGNTYNYAVHVPFYEDFMMVEEKRDAVSGNTTTLSILKKWNIYDILSGL